MQNLIALIILVTKIKYIIFLSSSFLLNVKSDISSAPKAPALADSQWPIAHGNTWNSDSTGLTGPSRNDADVELTLNLHSPLSMSDAISLVQSNVTGISWGSSVSSVFQIQVSDNEVTTLNSYFRDYNFEYHGAYSLLAYDGTYYAAAQVSIQAFNNKIPFDFSSEIEMKGEYFISGLDSNEHIVGLTISHDKQEDAYLIFATSMGNVGAVSLDFSKNTSLVQLLGIEMVSEPSHFVSNSIAMDGERGGIYVVTSITMNRLQWDNNAKKITLDWSTPYSDGKDQWFWGRLGPGSGTSPTLMGSDKEPKYVTICDGKSPMNILFFETDSGKLVGSSEVLFGQSKGHNSTTDQSLVVKGFKAVASNNWVANQVTPLCSVWFPTLNVTEALKHECPFIFGAFAFGLQQFSIDPNNNNKVKTEWINSHVSCTSSIPVVTADDVLFCLGKRILKGLDKYTIEAVDWNTGVLLFYIELSHSLLVNSLYASTGVGFNNDIVMGTLGGVLRVSNLPSNNSNYFNYKGLKITHNKGKDIVEKLLKEKEVDYFDELASMFVKGTIPSK